MIKTQASAPRGTDLAIQTGRRVCCNGLRDLRTEIVLTDQNDVAFWFSFSFRFATFKQQNSGKHTLSVTHQTRAKPKALFPKRRECGENTISGEDEPN